MTEAIDLLLHIKEEVEAIKAYLNQLNKSRKKSFDEEWLDGQDVLQLLHISTRTLQNLRDSKTLPFSKVKGKIYYKLSDIEALLESNYSLSKMNNHGPR